MYRFASHLSLGEKANAVSLTALRVVARMRRDWIVAGRRPAGVCAASLLIASRAHGFARTPSDVTKILRVCGVTVTSRVKEFELLPAAQLTLAEFTTKEIETEADPPSYTRNRQSEKKTAAILDGKTEEELAGTMDYSLNQKTRTTGLTKEKKEEKDAAMASLKAQLTSALMKGEKKRKVYEDDVDAETTTLAKSSKVSPLNARGDRRMCTHEA